MQQCLFYIDKKKKQHFSASWKYNWSHFKLYYQEEVICSFATKKELTAGRQFVMTNGHLLSVRLKRGLHPELELLLDGQPLASNIHKSHNGQSTVSLLAIFLGVLNMIAGLAAEITASDVMLSIGFGYGSVAMGVAFLLLAWGSRYLGSFAVFAVVALISLDMGLLFVFTNMREGPSSPTSGLLIKLFLIYAFIRGTRAMRQLKGQSTAYVF